MAPPKSSSSSTPSRRLASIFRDTKETTVQVSLALDGGRLDHLPHDDKFPAPCPKQTAEHHACQISETQEIWIWTGIGFLDHLLHALAKHAGWSLRLRCRGDLAIDDHHSAEDSFLALGSAVSQALGARTGLRRFGHAYAPLDEALARAVVDLSNRPYFVGDLQFTDPRLGQLATQMIPHCLQSFSQTAGLTLHVDILRGHNDHHRAEAAFKALAVALRNATEPVRGREGEVISTKGVL